MFKRENRKDNSVPQAYHGKEEAKLMSSIIIGTAAALQQSFLQPAWHCGCTNQPHHWRKTSPRPILISLMLFDWLHCFPARMALHKANCAGTDLFYIYCTTAVLTKTCPNKSALIWGCYGKPEWFLVTKISVLLKIHVGHSTHFKIKMCHKGELLLRNIYLQ